MLFLVHFDITPEHRDASHERFKKVRDHVPSGMNVVGPWFSVTQLEGWVIAEATDAIELGKWLHDWTDLNVNHITPVVHAEDLPKIVT